MSVLDQYIKYPKTMHFDFSLGLQNDDRMIETIDNFIGKRVIVSIKLDGENSTIYNNYFHPRSLIDDGHESRSWLKQFKSNFDYLIPDGWRVCGENLYAEHSIKYNNLETYFYCFNIWNNDICLSYDETKENCIILGIKHVPVIYDDIFNYEKIKNIYLNLDFNIHEGIVCRIADAFHYNDFQKYVAKAVRKGHVQTDEHWKNKKIIKNKLNER